MQPLWRTKGTVLPCRQLTSTSRLKDLPKINQVLFCHQSVCSWAPLAAAHPAHIHMGTAVHHMPQTHSTFPVTRAAAEAQHLQNFGAKLNPRAAALTLSSSSPCCFLPLTGARAGPVPRAAPGCAPARPVRARQAGRASGLPQGSSTAPLLLQPRPQLPCARAEPSSSSPPPCKDT